jgi:hypothetical protein
MQPCDSMAELWRGQSLDVLPSPNPPPPGRANLRRWIGNAVSRYLHWRTASALRRLDPAILKIHSINPDDIVGLFPSAAWRYPVQASASRPR